MALPPFGAASRLAKQVDGEPVSSNLVIRTMAQFILLSHERSGSHLLGEFLSGIQGLHAFDEVCNPHAVQAGKRQESYYGQLHRHIQAQPEYLLDMSFVRHYEWLSAYFGFLANFAAKPHSVVDIKYGHVHIFEQNWWQPLSRPLLFYFCERANIGIIHLYRENVVDAVASYMIAEQRKVWNTRQAEWRTAGQQKVELDATKLVNEAHLLVQHNMFMKRWIGTARHFTLTYEDSVLGLLSGCPLGEELCKFIGSRRETEFIPLHRKVTQPLPQVIANYDEVHAACVLSGLGRHVEGRTTSL